MMTMLRLALALAVLLGGATLARADEPRWPRAAEEKYEQAVSLSQRGSYADAAKLFREVADWPDGGAFPQRAQALYLVGLMHENAGQLEKALATYREVERRFPGTDHAERARRSAAALEEGGPRTLELRRRLDEAWASLPEAHEHDGTSAEERSRIEHAIELLEKLLRDFPDHPRAKDVALALGHAHSRLGRHRAAVVVLERAVQLARREAERPGAPPVAASDLALAEEDLASARRAVRRDAIDATACAVALGLLAAALAARPWRSVDRRRARLALALLGGDAVLALLAVGLAEYVRRWIDDHSPLEDGAAALLVLAPGATGIVVALSLAARARSRARAGVAGALGAVAALAVATVVVHRFGLWGLLDSEL